MSSKIFIHDIAKFSPLRVKQIQMKSIGRRLKYFREQMGISQLEFSHRSGISQASIARIESDQQKNLKTETIRKLADSLGISLSQLIEDPSIIKEEPAPYVTPKMLPVIKWDKFKNLKFKRVSSLKDSAHSFEPSLSGDQNAFFIIASAGLFSAPMVNEGDLLLIEPGIPYKDGDLVLFLSDDLTTLGRIYGYPMMTILLPLSKESTPHVLKKKGLRMPDVRILRVSEIRKKY